VVAALRLVELDPSQKADVVVISDCEDQRGRLPEAVERARERGVRVSGVLVGTAGGATIPTAQGPLRDDSGQIVTTHAAGDLLENLARGTGGVFLDNPFAQDALAPLLHAGPPGSPRESVTRVPIERFQWPLGLALCAFLAASLLNRGAE
jgi:Ca-activated chloride channel family protein